MRSFIYHIQSSIQTDTVNTCIKWNRANQENKAFTGEKQD